MAVVNLLANVVHPAATSLTEVQNFALTEREHDTTYSYKLFTGNGSGSTDPDVASTVWISSAHDILFDHCVFDTCTAVGTSGDYDGLLIGNGLRLYESGAGGVRHVYNITFQDCLVKSQPRMGIEVNGRGTTVCYQSIDFIRTTVQPCRSECFSMDDTSSDDAYCEIIDMTLGGAGYAFPGGYAYEWNHAFEINHTNKVLVNNLRTYSNFKTGLNLTGRDAFAMEWALSGIDVRQNEQYVDDDFPDGSGIVAGEDAHGLMMSGVVGTALTWEDVSIAGDNAWAISWLAGCSSVDLSDTTWSGDNNTTHGEDACTGITY